jgi:hypothetical protein
MTTALQIIAAWIVLSIIAGLIVARFIGAGSGKPR